MKKSSTELVVVLISDLFLLLDGCPINYIRVQNEFMVADFETEKAEYTVTLALRWVDSLEGTFSLPPNSLLGKKKTWTDPPKPEETWKVYKYTHIEGPYCFDEAKQKERARIGEGTEVKGVSGKRIRKPKSLKLPGEKTTTEAESSSEEESGSDEENGEDDEVSNNKSSTAVKAKKRRLLVPNISSGQRIDDAETLPLSGNQETVSKKDFDSLRNGQIALYKKLEEIIARVQPPRDGNGVDYASLPRFPMKSLKAVFKFNKDLEKNTVKEAFIAVIEECCERSLTKYIRRVLANILENAMLEKFSWSGQNTEKHCFKVTRISKCIVDVVSRTRQVPRADVEDRIKSKLQHAKDDNKRERRRDDRLNRAMRRLEEGEGLSDASDA